jgi:hypothetical protein
MAAAGINFTEGPGQVRPPLVPARLRHPPGTGARIRQSVSRVGKRRQRGNDEGQTALHGAAFLGGTQMVPLLVAHGAHLNAVNKRGQTPWSITQGDYHAVSFISHKETGDLLENSAPTPPWDC